MPRTAKIGPEVFARVNELVAEGKSRTEAFGVVSQERGQRPGTVAANYYRTARTQASSGGGRRRARAASPRKAQSTSGRAARRSTATPRSTTGDADVAVLATQIATLTQQLVRQIEERDAKLRALLK
jgi:hypothetical protein